MKIDVSSLDGVSATTLWTLRSRAVEAQRPDRLLDDPWATTIFTALDDDFDRFGKPLQAHVLRALAFDDAIRDHLERRQKATVVALGEGLQTTYWRLGRPDVDWLSVDLPPVVDLRERLLPAEPRVRAARVSALDRAWMDLVDPAHNVFISAEGLFMYLDRAEVMSLIADCARRFPGGRLIYDSIPAWYRRLTMIGLRLSDRYTAPTMSLSLSVSQSAQLTTRIPRVAAVTDIKPPPGRPRWRSRLARLVTDLPGIRDLRPAITLLQFDR
jgi:O-methyltransferase involved in polyketide biosynthesis